MVQDRFEDAVKEAELVDRLVQDYEDLDRLAWEKPLLGVPLTVKETVAVKGQCSFLQISMSLLMGVNAFE